MLLPVGSWGLLHGAPIGLGGAALLFLIWWTWACGRLPSRVAILLAAAFKCAALWALTAHGFQATYFAGERQYSAIERELTFDRIGAPTGLSAIVWRADVWARDAEPQRRFYVRSEGQPAELWIDGMKVVETIPPAEEAVWRAPWAKGRHRILVRLTPSAAPRRFEAGSIDSVTERTIPFDAAHATPRTYPSWRVRIDEWLQPVTVVIDIVVLAALVAYAALALARQRRNPTAVAWLAGAAAGFLVAWTARGHPLAEPANPAHSAWVSAVGWTFGNDLSSLYFVQWLAFCGVCWAAAVFVPPEEELH